MKRLILITGTDTGVGKTVLSELLTRHYIAVGRSVAAFKPLCSGGRTDAKILHSLLKPRLTLDEINPWHFPEPLSPLIAARHARRKVTLNQVAHHVRKLGKSFDVVIVEGAGGLLSPLGEDFDSRDLIKELNATPVVVAVNRLGVINQIRLVLAALPPRFSKRTQIVLMDPKRRDSSFDSNQKLLTEFLNPSRIHQLPWMNLKTGFANARVRRALKSIAESSFASI